MKVTLIGLGGMQPLLNPELLPENAATRASNCLLESGTVVPLRGGNVAHTTTDTSTILSAYRMVESSSAAWLTWGADVDVARVQFPTQVRYVFTGLSEPRITSYALATGSGSGDYPRVYYALGVPAPADKPSVAHSGGTGATVTRFYAYTFQTAWGEESALSPLSDATTGAVDDTWTISNLSTVPAFTDSRSAPINTTGLTVNLYRTEGSSGQWMWVKSFSPASSTADTILAADLEGDTLVSEAFTPPPKNLRGVVYHPSGALAGFYDNILCFSEPFQPHAWPEAYQMKTESKIVAIAVMGTTVAVLTAGKPQLCFGQEPGAMQMSDPGEAMPCLAKRSVVSLGDRVGFATDSGYATLSENGVEILTQNIWDYATWRGLTPASCFAQYAGGRLHLVMRSDETPQWYVFSLRGNLLTRSTYTPDALSVDKTTGQLYYTTGDTVMSWDDPEAKYQEAYWTSKLFRLPFPQNFAAARIRYSGVMSEIDTTAYEAERAAAIAANAAIIATGDAHGAYNARRFNARRFNAGDLAYVSTQLTDTVGVAFTLYEDDTPRYSTQVLNTQPFRLPSGYLYGRMKVGVASQAIIQSIELAESMAGLNVS